MSLEAAWRAKRERVTCNRGHPIPPYGGFGTVRRCNVCDNMRQAIRAAEFKIGPALVKTSRRPDGPKTHCPSGHPYSGTNLRISYRGDKICRTCANASVTRWKIEKIKQGLNPYRWSVKEKTIKKVERAAASGLLICEVKGRIRGAKALASPNTLISIRQFFPERWELISNQFKRNRKASFMASALGIEPTPSMRRAPSPVRLSSAEATNLMHLANRLMPKGITSDHRDDAVADLIKAVLEGELDLTQVNARAIRFFVRRQYQENHNRWGMQSLDEQRSVTGNFNLSEVVSRGLWD